VNDPIPAPSTVIPVLPDRLSHLSLRLLDRDPRLRMSNAAQVRQELEDILDLHARTSWEQELAPGLLDRLRAGDNLPAPDRGGRDLPPPVPQTLHGMRKTQRFPNPLAGSFSGGTHRRVNRAAQRKRSLMLAGVVGLVAAITAAFL